jgi:hypothetical protein
MPIEYEIDTRQKVVWARARGVLVNTDMFDYQREVWTRPEVAGYDEIVDMSGATKVEMGDADRMIQLATLAASSDSPEKPSRMAIVAPETLHYGLGRMYQAYRELDPRSTKEVRVFRSIDEALDWLGLVRTDA